MKWVLIIIGSLIALILAVAILGACTPRGHIASGRIHLNQPADKVWANLRDLGTWPKWNPGMPGMRREETSDGSEVWLVQLGWKQARMVADQTLPGRKFSTRVLDDAAPFTGSWSYEVTPAGDGCYVTITEVGEIGNPLLRFMARFFLGYHGTIRNFLEIFAKPYNESPEFEIIPIEP